MSYDKVKGIKIKNNHVLINSASNNLIPLTYAWRSSSYFDKILTEKGLTECETEILKAYEEGNFKAVVENKYSRALKVLYYVFADDYKAFDWRGNLDNRELRNSDLFKALLNKCLNYKIGKERYILSKIYNSDFVYMSKLTQNKAKWSGNREKAKEFYFKGECEGVKRLFRDSENWEIETK